jgi:glycosyltransferase involved in cell wall biosynthesis
MDRPSEKSMKILLVTGSFPPMKCGVGDYSAHLAKYLGREQDTSVAVLTDTAAASAPADTDFQLLPVARGWKISDIPPVMRAITRWNPDIVHIQYPTQGYGNRKLPWLLPAIACALRYKVVQTWHEYFPMGGYANLLNSTVPGGLIAVRPNYKEMMPSWYRWLIRNKIFAFIPNTSTIPFTQLTPAEAEEIRARFSEKGKQLVVYFGFVYPEKDVERIFEIADPSKHHLVLICDLEPSNRYHLKILSLLKSAAWSGRVTVTGFLPKEEAGRILAAADAVLFPLRKGGGEWNTSLHAAASQGTFVLTTSTLRHGYQPSENIFYSRPGDVKKMREALITHAGVRRRAHSSVLHKDWEAIAAAHVILYRRILGKQFPGSKA